MGGPEFVVLAGLVLGAADEARPSSWTGWPHRWRPCARSASEPGLAGHLVAGQRSREMAHGAVLEQLGLEPLLDLRMPPGKGWGRAVLPISGHGLQMRAMAWRVARTVNGNFEMTPPDGPTHYRSPDEDSARWLGFPTGPATS